MSDFTVSNGTQQVTIYPYQQLSSAYANTMLKDVVLPGASDVHISLADNVSSVTVTIDAGATFYFERDAVNPITPNNNVDTLKLVGKITLLTAATVEISKLSFWSSSTDTIYIVADWAFDPNLPSDRYVAFSIIGDASLADVKSQDGTTSHKIIVASLLNNRYFSDNAIEEIEGDITTNLALENYHISYDFVPVKNKLRREEEEAKALQVFFDSNGAGIYVGGGATLIGGQFIDYSSNMYNSLPYPSRGKATGSVVTTGITAPAVGARFYTTPAFDGALIDVIATNTRADYYQIDFLRLKRNYDTGSAQIVWESFLKPKPAPELGFVNFALTPEDLKGYVKQHAFPIVDDGITLAIVVRPRLSIDSSNTIWPEYTLVIKDEVSNYIGSVLNYSRVKLPIYQSFDLGL